MKMMAWKFRSNGKIWDVNPIEKAQEVYKKLCEVDPEFPDIVELVEVEVTEIPKTEKWAIKWEYRHPSGRGLPVFDEDECKRMCEKANKEFPEINHYPVKCCINPIEHLSCPLCGIPNPGRDHFCQG